MGEVRLNEISDRMLIRALKALADPTRFQMVREIAAAGELSCGAVAERFDVSQPTISHHLKVLVDAGLLVQRTEGKHHFTSINRALVASIVALLPKRLGSPPSKSAESSRPATPPQRRRLPRHR